MLLTKLKKRWAELLFLGINGLIVLIWFSVFPLRSSLAWLDIVFEGLYFSVALGSFFIVQKTNISVLTLGWAIFVYGLLTDLLDEFISGYTLLKTEIKGLLTAYGLLLIGFGLYRGVKYLQEEIAHREKIETTLRQNKEKYRLLAENIDDVIFSQDMDLNLTYISPSVKNLFGYSPREIIKLGLKGCMTSESYQKAMETFQEYSFLAQQKIDFDVPIMEYEYVCKNGATFLGEIHVNFLRDDQGNPVGIQGVLRDITERKQMEKKLIELSYHDSLTGLYNRAFFEEEMHRFESDRFLPLGLIICDVDGLKLINDNLGHQQGDVLLKRTASVLKSCFRESDIISRIGGDEFAVLLPQSGLNVVKDSYWRIRQATKKYNSESTDLPLSLSIGFAVSETSPVDIQSLFKQADDKMYHEKRSQRNDSYNFVSRILNSSN